MRPFAIVKWIPIFKYKDIKFGVDLIHAQSCRHETLDQVVFVLVSHRPLVLE